MRITFSVVRLPGTKRGICPVCGKSATRSRSWEQTINPWNKNAKGEAKSRAEIIEELKAEKAEWLLRPATHVKCGG